MTTRQPARLLQLETSTRSQQELLGIGLRLSFWHLLDMVSRRQADVVMVYSVDRIGRQMSDVISLVEKAKDTFDLESTEKLQKKMLSNTFTLADFQEQLSQMQKMGPLSDMLSMIPGANKMGKINLDDRQLKWIDAIIKSMTPEERNEPEIIDGSRRKRIALGCGRPVQEVNQLLKQFQQMRVMMKKIGKKGRMQIPFQIK
mgnify:CR=1 FL=1